MAQIRDQPLLSLCIPIYNRLSYLERQLSRMLEDKDLFDNKIQLIVSDNCSTDDLLLCCEKYQRKGLNLLYHRNEMNLGAEGNFGWCFHHSSGKYVWLLGSDDIPAKGLLREVVNHIKGRDYGLVHLDMKGIDREPEIYYDASEMIATTSYMLTFMSANIIKTKTLESIELEKYEGTFLIQVPAYINACLSSNTNSIIYKQNVFEKGDVSNNGGFNFFVVFVENFYSILGEFVRNGRLEVKAYDKIKEVEFKYYLLPAIYNIVRGGTPNYILKGAMSIMAKHYWYCPYVYYYPFLKGFMFLKKHIFG